MSGYHSAVRLLVKHNAEVVEPLYGAGSFGNELFKQLGNVLEVTASQCVKVVDSGGIAGLIGSLDAALSHHGVCVAVAELGNDHYVCAVLLCHYRRRGACSAAADDENVNIVVRLCKVNVARLDAAVRLKHCRKLYRYLFALVGADLKSIEFGFDIVGVEFVKESVLFVRGHAARLHAESFGAGRFHLLDGFKHFGCIHIRILLISR